MPAEISRTEQKLTRILLWLLLCEAIRDKQRPVLLTVQAATRAWQEAVDLTASSRRINQYTFAAEKARPKLAKIHTSSTNPSEKILVLHISVARSDGRVPVSVSLGAFSSSHVLEIIQSLVSK
ncbi:4-hydroxy-tetrahydrodipicolinate synthase [Striga asiatica]|uniref:4-hydroxy-tetrahydrodipicolinate synthase n=1 Tax=Striga asiatica TaxID=4170 RepID=A0A5A7QX50_STRAF|nr:4-hydroxy-tetrahydrodipicolinate synthase [Striga asiatica]